MNTEEKIDEIYKKMGEVHDTALTLSIEFKAFRETCKVKHNAIDEKVDDHHTDLYGNGKPGLIDRFNSLETRLIAWACVAVFAAQILLPKISKAIGW